jgi:hypothetical protein
MPKETLKLLEQDVKRLLMAGGSLAAGDGDLLKRQTSLTALAPKVPVLAKVAEQVGKVLSANPKQASIELLNLSSVLMQLRAAQAAGNASDDKLKDIEKVEPMETPIAPAQIDLIWKAFQGEAKNRSTIIEDAIEKKNIRDLRLLRPWIDLLDDSQWADEVVEKVLPELGKAAIAPLHKAFTLPGKSGDCYRLQGLVKLEGKGAEPLVMKALEKGSVELKETAIEELGALNPKELLARAPGFLKEKAAGIRRATIAAVAKHPSDQALDILIEALSDGERVVNQASRQALPTFTHPKRNERILALLTPDLLEIKEPTPAEVKKELAQKEAEKLAKAAAKKAGKAAKGAKGAKAVAKKAVKKVAAKKVAKKPAKKVAKKRARAVALTPVEQKEYQKRRDAYYEKRRYVEILLELIGECQIKEANPMLMKIFQEKTHTFKEEATQALLNLGEPKAMEEIAKRLGSVKNRNETGIPLDAIFKMPPTKTYDTLAPYLEPKQSSTKMGAILAHAIIDRFTEDPWPSMLDEDVFKAQFLAEPRWKTLLTKLLENEKLGASALVSLRYSLTSWSQITPEELFELLKPHITKEKFKDAKNHRLIDSLTDEINYAYGDDKKLFALPEWTEFLANVMETTAKTLHGARYTATDELLERNDPRAVPGLIERLTARYTPWNFFDLLRQFKDPRISPALLKRIQKKHSFDLASVYETIRQQYDKSVLPTLKKMLDKKKRGKEAEEIKKTIKHLES